MKKHKTVFIPHYHNSIEFGITALDASDLVCLDGTYATYGLAKKKLLEIAKDAVIEARDAVTEIKNLKKQS